MKKISKRFKKFKNHLAKKVHRSFRFTKIRDARRDLDLPGYFRFNHLVFKFIFNNKKIFLSLIAVSALSAFLLFGMSSQSDYTTLVETLKSSSGDFFEGMWGSVESAGLLFLAAVTGSISQDISEAQQIFAVFVVVMTWLVSVWVSRNILAGNKIKLRDGIYNAGAPIMAMIPLVMLAFVQLLPIGIAAFGYGAAMSTGLLNGGVEAMMFWVVAFLMAVLSVYWLSSTLMSLVIITIPGVYPARALSMSREILFGRRLRIMLRVLWLSISVLFGWVLILLPFIMIDMLIRSVWSGIGVIPVIPIVILIMGAASTVWCSVYIYMLYRKIVDGKDS